MTGTDLLRLTLMLAAGLCVPACAQQAPSPDPAANADIKPPPLPDAAVTGRVICGDTRLRARGATVMLQRLPDHPPGPDHQYERGLSFVARVALDGTYRVNHVVPGEYAVVAFLPGYVSALDGTSAVMDDKGNDAEEVMLKRLRAGTVVHVDKEGTVTADITLERGATVSGHVFYADGAPAMQVDLEVRTAETTKKVDVTRQQVDIGGMMRNMLTHQTMSTDDRGFFRISGIAPGRYYLAVVSAVETDGLALNSAFAGMAADSRSMRFYAGDTVHRKSAKIYELRGADNVEDVEIRLPIDGLHAVTGSLQGTDRKPVSFATLLLIDAADETLTIVGSMDSTGAFRFSGVPPGTYKLLVNDAGRYSTTEGIDTIDFADSTTSVIVLDHDTTDLVLQLQQKEPLAKAPKQQASP